LWSASIKKGKKERERKKRGKGKKKRRGKRRGKKKRKGEKGLSVPAVPCALYYCARLLLSLLTTFHAD